MSDRNSFNAPGLIGLAGCIVLYPFILKGFHASLASGSTLLEVLMLLLIFAAPVAGVAASIKLGRILHPDRRQVWIKWLALLAVSAPPIYTAMGVLLYMAGDPIPDTHAWLIFCALMGLTAIGYGGRHQSGGNDTAPSRRLRFMHGANAVAILLLFLGMHLSNHLAGLISEASHRQLMDIFRHVYRAHLLEPLIVLLFLFQVVSGLVLLGRATLRPADFFRTVQLVSGGYLLFFILGHMNSVFIYARSFANIQTDWNFAVGAPTGLMHDGWNIRLVPHYYLGVFFVLTHLVLGARVVALAHGVPRGRADMLAKAGIALAAIIAFAILTGMAGVHVLPG